MRRIHVLFAPRVIALGLSFVATTAEAAPGIARVTVSLHSRASLSSSVLATMKTGSYLVVRSCTLYWCKVHRSGLDGYVLRTQLYNPYFGSKFYYQFPPYTPVPGRTNRSDLR